MPKGGSAVVANPQADDVQYPCLVRAVYKKNKISTIVSRYRLYMYSSLCANALLFRLLLMILIDSKTPIARLSERTWTL